jgi:hypothetical protein
MDLDWIKTYSLSELMKMDHKHNQTIQKSFRYIPILVENWLTNYNYRNWKTQKPYTVKYIKYDDLKKRFESNHDKKLSFL